MARESLLLYKAISSGKFETSLNIIGKYPELVNEKYFGRSVVDFYLDSNFYDGVKKCVELGVLDYVKDNLISKALGKNDFNLFKILALSGSIKKEDLPAFHHTAITTNNIKFLEYMQEFGYELSASDDDGFNAFNYIRFAPDDARSLLVEYLLKKKCPLLKGIDKLEEPVYFALNKNWDALKEFAKAGLDFDDPRFQIEGKKLLDWLESRNPELRSEIISIKMSIILHEENSEDDKENLVVKKQRSVI